MPINRAWYRQIDWLLVAVWGALVGVGLLAIYSTTRGPAAEFLLATVQQNFDRQVMWLGVSAVLMGGILLLPVRWIDRAAYPAYVLGIVLLVLTLLFGREINGARRWLYIGPVGLQISEIAKVTSLLAVAKFMASRQARTGRLRYAFLTLGILAVPAAIVIMQNDTGTSLPYLAIVPMVLFWSGAPLSLMALMVAPALAGYLAVLQHDDPAPYYALTFAAIFTLGMLIATRDKWYTAASAALTGVFGFFVWLGITSVLRPHQISRIIAFTNPQAYADTAGYHVIQSKAAIGQGGLTGRGFMQGTQTQMAFIPEQSTDFIYSVIGEEFGLIGALVVLALLATLLIRVAWLGQRSAHAFARMFAAGVCGIFLVHTIINVGMTIGVFPVIGLPLPFVSYGGSALLANTALVAIVLNLYARREEFAIYRGSGG
jgi:rod shape determining protein RodA